MTDPGNLPRVYGEKEIGRILQRATELQHAEPTAPATGVTLAELEEIAVEAGIDPRFLRRAAGEIDAGVTDTSFWTKVVGDQLMLIRELSVPGELEESGFERIVETILTNSQEHGQPSLLGKTLTWRAETPSKLRTIQLSVASRDGHTQIRLEENLTQLASAVFWGTTAGAGLGIGTGVGIPAGLALGSALLATALPIGVVAASFIGSRWVYRSMVRTRTRRIGRLFDAVVEAARVEIAARALPEVPPTPLEAPAPDPPR